MCNVQYLTWKYLPIAMQTQRGVHMHLVPWLGLCLAQAVTMTTRSSPRRALTWTGSGKDDGIESTR